MKCFFILIYGLLLVLFSSCGRTIQCLEPQVDPILIGYTPAQLHGMVIRKYEEGSGFRKLLDTIRLDTNTSYINTPTDTIEFNNHLYSEMRVGASNDWELYIPVTRQTFRLSDFESNQKMEKCGALQSQCYCFNNLYSLKLNGQMITPIPVGYGSDSYKFFIRY